MWGEEVLGGFSNEVAAGQQEEADERPPASFRGTWKPQLRALHQGRDLLRTCQSEPVGRGLAIFSLSSPGHCDVGQGGNCCLEEAVDDAGDAGFSWVGV